MLGKGAAYTDTPVWTGGQCGGQWGKQGTRCHLNGQQFWILMDVAEIQGGVGADTATPSCGVWVRAEQRKGPGVGGSLASAPRMSWQADHWGRAYLSEGLG